MWQGAAVICHSRGERIRVRRVFIIIIVSFSRRDSFQVVLVMQPAEDFSGRDARVSRQLVSTSMWRKPPPQVLFRVGGDTRAQGRMWTALIVVGYPLPQSLPQMLLAERDHVIQTLTPHRSD